MMDLTATPPVTAEELADTLAKVSDADFRRTLYYIQARSLEPGGCRALAAELLERYRDHIGHPSVLNAIREGRDALTHMEYRAACNGLDHYPSSELKYALDKCASVSVLLDDFDRDQSDNLHRYADQLYQEQAKQDARRKGGQIAILKSRAWEMTYGLPDCLRQLCLRGRSVLDGNKYSEVCPQTWFPDLLDCLRECRQGFRPGHAAPVAETSILRRIHKCIDDAWNSAGFALIHGNSRIGKTTAARSWVEANYDKARYVSLQAGGGEISFFRCISEALGCTYFANQTAARLRDAVFSALRGRDLMLVIDEAHLLFGTSNRVSISRIEWLRTALINEGIPVVLLTTPQFQDRINQAGQQSGFNLDQFKGRLSNVEVLPAEPEADDFAAVAKTMIPDAKPRTLRVLAAYGQASVYYFQAMARAVAEARRLTPEGSEYTDYIEQAVARSMGVDNKLENALGVKSPKSSKRRKSAPRFNPDPDEEAVKPSCTPLSGHRQDAPSRTQGPRVETLEAMTIG